MTLLQRLRSFPHNVRQLPGLAAAGVVLIGLLGSSCQGRTDAKERYTEAQLDGYAHSIIEIEPERKAAVEQIREINGTEQVPAIACSEPGSLDGHTEEIREIAVGYCERSIEIARAYNLSVDVFNGITEELPQDPLLEQEIAARVKCIIDPECVLDTQSPKVSSENPEEKS